MVINSDQNSLSIRDVINLRHQLPRYSCGIKKLNASLYEGCGFRSGLIYDLNCVPGNVGKWELIFRIILECLQSETSSATKKVLVVQTFDQIPWFKLRKSSHFHERFVNHIQVVQVQTLSQLIVFLQNSDFSKFKMVLIDGFQDLYRMNRIEIQKQINRNRKRRRKSTLTNNMYTGPIQKLYRVMEDIVVTLASIASKYQLVIITTGKCDVFNQRIRQEELNTESNSEERSDTDSSTSSDGQRTPEFFIQRILVPAVSLQDHVSELYTNRIILYNDWIRQVSPDGPVTTGLDKTTSIKKYIELLNGGRMKSAPHFLIASCGPSKSANQRFTEGWFKIDAVTFDIIDVDNVENVLPSTSIIGHQPLETDEIADSQ